MPVFRNSLPILLPAILFVYLLLLSFGSGHPELSYDEAYWSYIGQHWLQGELLPYADAIDNKPAGLLLFYGLSVKFFGVSAFFPRVIGSLCLALAGWLLLRLGFLLHSPRAGYITFLLFALANTWKSAGWRFTAQAESVLALLSVAAFLLLFHSYTADGGRRWGRLGLAAACPGLAMCIKQSAILTTAAFVIAVLLLESAAVRPQRLRVLLIVLTMLLLPTVCFIAALALSGVTPDLYLHSLLLPPDSYSLLAGGESGFFTLRVQLFWEQFLPRNIRLAIPVTAAALALSSAQTYRSVPLRRLLAVWIFCDFLILPIGGTYATYQLRSWLPSLVSGSGIGLAHLLQHRVAEQWQKPVFAALILVLLFSGLQLHPELLRHPAALAGGPSATDQQRRELGLWINQHSAPAELVYVAGFGAQVQAYAERCSPSRYFAGGVIIPVKELGRELNERPPQLLLIPAYPEYQRWTPAELRRLLQDFVQSGYRNVGERYGYTIYFREGTAGAGRLNPDSNSFPGLRYGY